MRFHSAYFSSLVSSGFLRLAGVFSMYDLQGFLLRAFFYALFCTASSACNFTGLLSRALSRGHLTSYMNSFAWMSSMGFIAGLFSLRSFPRLLLHALSQGFYRGLLPRAVFRELFRMHDFRGFFRGSFFRAFLAVVF